MNNLSYCRGDKYRVGFNIVDRYGRAMSVVEPPGEEAAWHWRETTQRHFEDMIAGKEVPNILFNFKVRGIVEDASNDEILGKDVQFLTEDIVSVKKFLTDARDKTYTD